MVLKIATVSFLGTVALGVGLLLCYRPIMAGVRVLSGVWGKWTGNGNGDGIISSSAGDDRGLLATTLDEDVEKRRRR